MVITMVFNLKSGDITALSRLSKVDKLFKGLNAGTIRNSFSKHPDKPYIKGDYRVIRVELQ